MPYRKTPIATGETYHVFNRSIARQPIFLTSRDYSRALDVFLFYSFANLPVRFSHYNRLPIIQKTEMLDSMEKKNKKIIQVFAFCFMPNHLHFLLKQLEDRGISTFMSNFQNSYAKYFNLRTDRSGNLFQSMFKAVRIETDEQFLHVNRYIHLNPLTSFVLEKFEQLEGYPWCSFFDYVNKKRFSVLDTDTILSNFRSVKEFIKFTKDQMSYQRELDKIKHLVLE